MLLNLRDDERAGAWDRIEGRLPVENYSTVKSVRRLSATLSMRLNRRVQSIDM
jgi:hypothetical protein